MTTFLDRTDCPLYDSAYYSYPIIVEGNTFTLTFVYNDVMKLYTMSIRDASNRRLLSGVGITPNFPIIIDYDIEGFSGFFILEPKGDPSVEYYKDYPENLSKYYNFYYFNNTV